jgi:hypothetical protein
VLIGNRDYISLRNPSYVTHSAGKYAAKRFRKANCPIIERLTNSLMMHGRNNGKKLMAVRIVAHAFEIVCRNPREYPGTFPDLQEEYHADKMRRSIL